MEKEYRIIRKGTPFYSMTMEAEITYTKDILVLFYFIYKDDNEKLSFGCIQNTWIGGAVDKENGHIAILYSKTEEYQD